MLLNILKLESNMEKVILFDFFGVISSEVSPIWFKRYFNEEAAKIVKEEIMSKGLKENYEKNVSTNRQCQ